MLVGFDLASRKCGWCAGTGATVPVAGAILMDQVGDDLGWMVDQFDKSLFVIVERFKPTHFLYEAPILVSSRDNLLTVRKLYNLGGHLEWRARTWGIVCVEASLRQIKRELTGSTKAD